MIGVVVDPADEPVVREFFQLFKIDWEFYRPGQRYEALICSAGLSALDDAAPLTIIYGTHRPGNGGTSHVVGCGSRPVLRYRGDRIPIYGTCKVFSGTGAADLVDDFTGQPAMSRHHQAGRVFRIGYNLFGEIRYLLENGQPAKYAYIPTIELHIAILRDLLRENGVSFLEIPSTPADYPFTVCLTHDVDHATVRSHVLDRTIAGFIWRAIAGSFVDFVFGRKRLADVVTNWLAVVRLPFVYFGIASDFWSRFDQYSEIEGGVPSTFFVVPKSREPGKGAPEHRAVGYRLAEIGPQLHSLSSTRHEIGVHGVDAWCDIKEAATELEIVRQAVRPVNDTSGVRMHWLYYAADSAAILDRAGYSYDSTLGYNDAVGYRSGTSQAYKPLTAERLLELPMHVMDTALLFPGRMNLSFKAAKKKVDALIANARRFGGVLTINWHDRSIAPERLWGGLYQEILADLKKEGAWFATASDAVAWFNKRRAAKVESLGDNQDNELNNSDSLPRLSVQYYNCETAVPGKTQKMSAKTNARRKSLRKRNCRTDHGSLVTDHPRIVTVADS